MDGIKGVEDPEKVRHMRCPRCGDVRPYDWFRQYLYCWRCRESRPELRGIVAGGENGSPEVV